jgi:hypothetical protein
MQTHELSWCYQVLEVNQSTPQAEVKNAYRDLVKIWHPDRFAHDTRLQLKCQKRTQDLNEAFHQLDSLIRLGIAIEEKPLQASSPPARERSRESLVVKPISLDGRWGYATESGRIVVTPRFDSAGEFSEGLAAVESNYEFGYIDVLGNYAIEPRFEAADEFSEGLAAVCHASKFGYINRSGSYVIRPRYDSAERFSEGYAGVNFNGKCGYIRRDGTWLAAPEFNEVHPFENGRAYARAGRQWMIVDTSGRVHQRV